VARDFTILGSRRTCSFGQHHRVKIAAKDRKCYSGTLSDMICRGAGNLGCGES
jgi:hypothetical protein